MGKIVASIERPKAKTVSASGGFAPRSHDKGLCSWTPLGEKPPNPRYRLTLHMLTMAFPFTKS